MRQLLSHPRVCKLAAPHGRAKLALSCASLMLALNWSMHASPAAHALVSDWELTPYRLRLTLAADTALRPQPGLLPELAQYLAERADTVVGPLWQLEVKVAEDPAARRQCLEPQAIAADKLPTELKDFDKLMWLSVHATPTGSLVRCREFDAHTQRWGALHEQPVVQQSYLPQAGFELLKQTFAPIAEVRLIPDDNAQVGLVFKGSALPRRSDVDPLVAAGDVLQPLLRRTDRAGRLAANGILPVPWTFLTAKPGKDGAWIGDVQSGTRRPFAAQRLRIEQVAIAVRNPPGAAKIRFHARSDKNQGLAGYEVFRTRPDGTSEPLGLTDRDGMITVPPTGQPVDSILLRSDGQLLAKIPVPSGAGEVLQTPIADNLARLRARAEAQVLQEELIDVVARRAIMMGRVRALLKQNRVNDARELMGELDSLPTASVFGRSIDAAAKRIPTTDDPAVKRSIDTMFTQTRDMMLKFLNSRPIADLLSEVNNAAKPGS